jgi:hypothetical protein
MRCGRMAFGEARLKPLLVKNPHFTQNLAFVSTVENRNVILCPMTERYRFFVVVDRKYGERLAELAETVLRSVILERRWASLES